MPAAYFDKASGGVLDAGLSSISTRATKILLVSNYTLGEDYATVVGRSLGDATISGADFGAISDSGNDRQMTFNGKSGTATADDAAPTDLHLVITNGTDTILCVTDETSNQAITNGNTLNFPSFTITMKQPTLAA